MNCLNETTWPYHVAKALTEVIRKTHLASGSCSFMLTGGRSAASLYRVWGALPDFGQLRNIDFYFSDERCVSPDHVESNFGLTMRTLFKNGVPPTCRIIRMSSELRDQMAAVVAYEAQLPKRLDVLLLSVGEDGHIASLFPKSSALFEKYRRVVNVLAPNPPFERLTVTPDVILNARNIFVMAIGEAKADIYKRATLAPKDVSELPARLVLDATWFVTT